MNKENTDVSRRSFLTKGVTVAAGAAIIAIPALAENAAAAEPSTSFVSNDPVYTEAYQTLINKTISAANNTLIIGTESRNIKEFSISGTDISTALTAAINSIGLNGGRILIPRGVWEANGGYTIPSGITIEGIGINSGILNVGSVIKLKSGQSSFMFKLLAPTRNVTFKDFAIDLSNNSSAVGIHLTNIGNNAGTGSHYIYDTTLENVGIYGGDIGIHVQTDPNNSQVPQYECILNRFERVNFVGTRTCFKCDTVNTGFTFDNCHFYLPTTAGSIPAGVALNCYRVGNLSLNHCLFVGTQVIPPLGQTTDGSIILKTIGEFNNISFDDCQDENVHYAYVKDTYAWRVVGPVYKNCLIQSHFLFNVDGNLTLDSCRCGGKIYATATGTPTVFLRGNWNFFGYAQDQNGNWYQETSQSAESHGVITPTTSPRFLYEKYVEKPTVQTISDMVGIAYYNHNLRGAVEVKATTNYVQVFNNNVTANTLVFLQLRSFDSGGARIRDVTTYHGSFVIALTQPAASNLSVGFVVEA